MMKVSYCITCMGRLHHLEQTLPVNLVSTSSYPDREFVLLNYNSPDGLHSWARRHLRPWVERGVVRYYRTESPSRYVSTHAKNLAHRLATGDILCNLDADNFLFEGFSQFLVKSLEAPVVVAAPSLDRFGHDGACGRVAVRREHFYSVNGYDEAIHRGWGWDDADFRYRAQKQNGLDYFPAPPGWFAVIPHSNEERVRYFEDKDGGRTSLETALRLREVARTGRYVANAGRRWGWVPDLSPEL